MKLQIVAATGNENKVREIREILDDSRLCVISMQQAGIQSNPEENGTSFEENAKIKAREAAKALFCSGQKEKFNEEARQKQLETDSLFDPHLPTAVLADDSGLVIDALGGAPGIYSARYLGRDTDYHDKMHSIMDEMKDLQGKDRSARFTCACAAIVPSKWIVGENLGDESPVEGCREFVVVRSMEGEIGTEILGDNGFGYDPFFYLPDRHKTSAQLTEEEKNGISHRGKAFRAMKDLLFGVMS